MGVVRIFVIFNIYLCSATSRESFRRDLSNAMREHRCTLKNNQNTYVPRFGVTPKIRIALPKTGFNFYGIHILYSLLYESTLHGLRINNGVSCYACWYVSLIKSLKFCGQMMSIAVKI